MKISLYFYRAAFLLLLVLGGTELLSAEPVLMKHMVYRDCSPSLPPGSFGTLSRVLYISGDKGRSEEQLDPVQKLQELIVSSGKDIYLMNMVNKTGSHMVDPGPTYGFYVVFFPDEMSQPDLKHFCLGFEAEFMKSHNVPLKTGTPDGSDSYQTTVDGYDLLVLVSPTTHEPTEVQVTRGKTLIAKIVYEEYEEVPENPALFQPPPDVSIQEAKKATPPPEQKEDSLGT